VGFGTTKQVEKSGVHAGSFAAGGRGAKENGARAGGGGELSRRS
jgi:hypothetical protein